MVEYTNRCKKCVRRVENVDKIVDGLVLLNRYYRNIMRALNGYRLAHTRSYE